MFRRICYELHLWLGVITGVILFIVCLTGAILVFREDIKTLLFPASFGVNVPKDAVSLPLEELIAKIEANNKGKKISSITFPASKSKPVSVMLMEERRQEGERGEGRGNRGEGQGMRGMGRERNGERNNSPAFQGRERSGGHGHGGGMSLVNPYTGEALPKANSESLDRFFMTMLQLHRNLMLNYPVPFLNLGPRASIGKYIVGIATLIYIAVSITRFFLWLPKFKLWKSWKLWKIGLGIRFRSGFWRFVYDIHNTVGFYTLIPMLILALTGLCWSFSWYRDAASWVLGDQIFKQRMQRPAAVETPDETMQLLPIAKLLELQKEYTPLCGDLSVSLPQTRDAAVVISQKQTGFFALNAADRTEWDGYRGKVVAEQRFADLSFGAKIAALVRPLHFGDFTGMSSKIIFFTACSAAASFPLTGVMLWGHKLVVRRRKKKNLNPELQIQNPKS